MACIRAIHFSRSLKYKDISLNSYANAKELILCQALSGRTPEGAYESGQCRGALILQKYSIYIFE